MNPYAEFLRARGLAVGGRYTNGDPIDPAAQAQAHLDTIGHVLAEVSDCYREQKFLRKSWQLTEDDVVQLQNHYAETKHELDLVRWRATHGNAARDIDRGVTRVDEARTAALQARPMGPALRAHGSNLPLPTFGYDHEAALHEYLESAQARKVVPLRREPVRREEAEEDRSLPRDRRR